MQLTHGSEESQTHPLGEDLITKAMAGQHWVAIGDYKEDQQAKASVARRVVDGILFRVAVSLNGRSVVGVQNRWALVPLLGSSSFAFASSCIRAVFPPHNPVKRQLQTLITRVFFSILWWDTTTPRETRSVVARIAFTQTAAPTRSMPAVDTQSSQEQSKENQQEWRSVT